MQGGYSCRFFMQQAQLLNTTALTRTYPANPTTRASMPQMAYSVRWACSCFDACNTDDASYASFYLTDASFYLTDASFYLTDAGFYLTISTSFKISTKQHLLALIRDCWQLPPSASDWNSRQWFTASFFQPPSSWQLLTPQVSKNCQLTDSFSLVFKWQ